MTASIPAWPFAILFALVSLGYRLSRTRVVRPRTVATVAIAMLVFSLYGVAASFGANALALIAWTAGVAISILMGGAAFAPSGLTREGSSVRVPGSWLPLFLLLGIFAGKFALGFAHGAGLHVVHEPWLVAGASAVFGLLSGAFAARAMAVHRFANAAGDA